MTGTTDAQQRARAIRLLLLDVDGVLSDGGIVYDSEGRELKRFHIHDGLGIKLLQQHGIQVGIITGRVSPMVERRAKELGIGLLIQGREDKAHAMHEAMAQLSLTLDAVAYMGDDLPVFAAITQAGLGIAPANAVNIVRQHADLVTIASGGHGAVREAAELILAAQGQLDTLHARYIQH
ncbi:MAG TPA: HAD hydrolase family protein [Pseudomonadales bacterium]|nr:HAD hydrolase family protein [Pseudomonadales bacterium]